MVPVLESKSTGERVDTCKMKHALDIKRLTYEVFSRKRRQCQVRISQQTVAVEGDIEVYRPGKFRRFNDLYRCTVFPAVILEGGSGISGNAAETCKGRQRVCDQLVTAPVAIVCELHGNAIF